LNRPAAVQPLHVRPNQEWALDFVADRLETGRGIRVLTIVDAFTRECLGLDVDTSLSSRRVTRTLEQVILERGTPGSIRCDNELNASLFSKAGAGTRFSARQTRTAPTAANELDTEWSSTNKGTLLTIMNTRSAAMRSLHSA